MNGAVENVYMGEKDGMSVETPGVLETDLAALLLSWIDWVEVEVRGWPDLMERMSRLREAVMVAMMAGGVMGMGINSAHGVA